MLELSYLERSGCMKYYISTLGCKVNTYESSVICDILTNAGFTKVSTPSLADICIVNTCTVTNTADNKSLKVVRQMHRYNENAIIVVCGCMAQKDASKVKNIPGVAVILGNRGKTKIVDYINEKGGPDKVSIEEIEEAADEVDEDELMEKIVITEGYYVTMEIEDGEGETSQGDIIVYRINDGGWKVLVPYGSDIRRNYAQEQVKSLFKACNSALCDMDEEDLLNYDAKPFIVSSDESMNYNVPNDFDVEVFKQKTKNYMSIITGIEWFAVLQDGVVIYTVIMNPNTEVNSVTFPHESIIYKDTEQENLKTQSVEDPKSYDELYEICKSVINAS